MSWLIVILYCFCLLLLFFFSMGQLHLTWLYLKHLRQPKASLPLLSEAALPLVTIQLPLYNERYVAERLLEAVAALQYPPDKLQIQVLDDSTDDTLSLVAQKNRPTATAGGCG